MPRGIKKTTTVVLETNSEADAESKAIAVIVPDFSAPPAVKLLSVDASLAIIEAKAKEYSVLKITSVEDKEGYEKVVAAMGEMKKSRTAYINSAYENFVDPLKKSLKEFEADLDKIATAFKNVEQPLRDKKNFIDNEKIRLKAEAELEKVRVMQLRVNDLNLLGAEFDGMVYTFSYSQDLMITAGDIKDNTVEEFQAFLNNVHSAKLVENERIAEEQRQQEETLAEQQRQAEQVQQQATANEAATAALNERRTKLRLKELKMLGYSHNPETDDYQHEAIPIAISLKRIDEDTDLIWDELIYDLEHFTPAEEPLLNYQEPVSPAIVEALENSSGPVTDYGNSDTHAKPFSLTDLGNTVERIPDDVNAQTGITKTDLEPGYHPEGWVSSSQTLYQYFQPSVEMIFSREKTHEDVEISPKYIFRVFPDEYADVAINGCSIGKEGKIQGLNYAIVVKV